MYWVVLPSVNCSLTWWLQLYNTTQRLGTMSTFSRISCKKIIRINDEGRTLNGSYSCGKIAELLTWSVTGGSNPGSLDSEPYALLLRHTGPTDCTSIKFSSPNECDLSGIYCIFTCTYIWMKFYQNDQIKKESFGFRKFGGSAVPPYSNSGLGRQAITRCIMGL